MCLDSVATVMKRQIEIGQSICQDDVESFNSDHLDDLNYVDTWFKSCKLPQVAGVY